MILIERARILIFDKIKIFKEELKKKIESKKSCERPSASTKYIQLIFF